jgi:hypothetical protein
MSRFGPARGPPPLCYLMTPRMSRGIGTLPIVCSGVNAGQLGDAGCCRAGERRSDSREAWRRWLRLTKCSAQLAVTFATALLLDVIDLHKPRLLVMTGTANLPQRPLAPQRLGTMVSVGRSSAAASRDSLR